MDLRQLRAFLHVAELGSLSRAAERLHLTQPALSRRIQMLEDDLGARLFDRTGRGVVLTETGAQFEARIRPLVGDLEQAAEDAAEDPGVLSGDVTIAVPPSIGATTLVNLLRQYRDMHPKVHLRAVVAMTGAVHEGLVEGKLDLGFLYRPVESASLVAEDLWTETLHVVAAKGSDLPTDRPVTLAEVADHPLVMSNPKHGLRAIVETRARQAGLKLNVPIEADSLRLQMEMIKQGLGWGLLPRRGFAGELAAGEVIRAPVSDPPMMLTMALVRARDRRLSRAAGTLADMIRNVAGSWVGEFGG